MKEFTTIHKANSALSSLGKGERIMVGSRPYRVTSVFGSKALKPQANSTGEDGISFIPGGRFFNKTANGGKSTSSK
jgi:hypothetical protein